MLRVIKGLVLSLAIISVASAANANMFGHAEEKYSDIKDFKKWKEVVNKNDMDLIVNDPTTEKWKETVAQLNTPAYTREQKIAAVNSLINRSITYSDDSIVWGKSDYWASPSESFRKGYGDCDDYAIAKYFSLKMLGFRDDEMRIVVLKDNRKNQLHAVLAVDDGGRNYILDNQLPDVMVDTQIAYYQPIYSINTVNWWKHS